MLSLLKSLDFILEGFLAVVEVFLLNLQLFGKHVFFDVDLSKLLLKCQHFALHFLKLCLVLIARHLGFRGGFLLDLLVLDLPSSLDPVFLLAKRSDLVFFDLELLFEFAILLFGDLHFLSDLIDRVHMSSNLLLVLILLRTLLQLNLFEQILQLFDQLVSLV